MSQEWAEWRRHLREGYEEFQQNTRYFNRNMDRNLEHYTNQMDAATNNTRHEIIQLLESIVHVVREHDDQLDGMRSMTLENMQRISGAFRGG
eukprot:8703658-Karenia_brevis.AAC.1